MTKIAKQIYYAFPTKRILGVCYYLDFKLVEMQDL